MATRKVDYPCMTCKEHVKRTCKAVQCSLCQLWVHVACEGMVEECYKVLCNADKYGGMYWSCRSCTAFAAKFNASIQDINRRLTTLEKKVDDRDTEVDQVKSDVREIKDSISGLKGQSVQAANHSSEKVFSELRERENRKLNVIVHNLKESSSRKKEDRIQEDKDLLSEVFSKMNIRVNENEVKFLSRVGRKPDDGCRPLLIGLKDPKIKDMILDSSYKLSECDEPWSNVNVIPDLTKIQRNEEKEIRDEAKKRNDERSEEERKNFQWRVVGRRGMSRLVKTAATPFQENRWTGQARVGARRPSTRR